MPSEFYEYCYGSLSLNSNVLPLVNSSSPTNESYENWGNDTAFTHQGIVLDQQDILLREIKYIITWLGIPVLCALGVIG